MPKGRKKGQSYSKKNFNKLENIIKRFDKRFIKLEDNVCWNWLSPIDNYGYGVFYMFCKQYKAHRASWILSGKDIPDGMLICHRCNNRKCVNPRHLYAGSHHDNMKDLRESGNLKGENNPRFGKPWSDEKRKLISERVKEAMKRPDVRKKFIEGIKRNKK